MSGTFLALRPLSYVFSQMTRAWSGADHRGRCCGTSPRRLTL